MEPNTNENHETLRRRLGTFDAAAVALGAMVGAGVFVSIGEAAGVAGNALLLAIPLAALSATFNALSSVELGVCHPRAGGGYEFGYQRLSPTVGFLAGWIFLLAAITAGATFTLTFANYLRPLLPGVSVRVLGMALAVAAIAVNAVGARLSARVNNTLVVIKVGILLLFLGFALPRFNTENLSPLLSGSVGGVLRAAALLFFAFTGYARPVTLVEELREPRRSLPRAVVVALIGTTLLYLAVAITALGSLGPERLASAPAPLRTALEPGVVGPLLLSVGAMIATASVLLTEIWGVSRLAFAMARRDDLPGLLRRLSGPQRTPRNAVLLLGGMIALLTATVNLTALLSASSLALLLYYGIVNLAALRLGPEERLYSPLVPVAGLTACVALALSLPLTALLTVAGAAAVGLAFFSARRRVGRSTHRGSDGSPATHTAP